MLEIGCAFFSFSGDRTNAKRRNLRAQTLRLGETNFVFDEDEDETRDMKVVFRTPRDADGRVFFLRSHGRPEKSSRVADRRKNAVHGLLQTDRL